METYDDRPISVYDNLNMPNALHTSTPKTRATTKPAVSTTSTVLPTAAGAPRATTNGAANTSYADISFKFNGNSDNNAPRQYSLPHSNASLNRSMQSQQQQQQQQKQHSQVHLNPLNTQHTATVHYATPFKPTATNTSTPNPAVLLNASSHTTTHTKARPLSQHSQSELNAASQNIAAVKAALNDAKSKFFGLNGYAQDSLDTGTATSSSQGVTPQVQKPQPKYQNIPENSAIFRKQRPELPPKPSHLVAVHEPKTSGPQAAAHSTPASRSTSPAYEALSPDTDTYSPSVTAAITPMPTQGDAISPASGMPSPITKHSGSPGRTLPYGAAYKQVPLNDIETSQPSQAVYMSTTVPQNLKGSKIAGRHTPTRNSLRHSRMLVVNNKNYRAMQHANPMNFKHPNLARWLLILQLIIGISICCLAIWIFVLAPNTAIQENPYWSGLALLMAGVLGLVLVRYRRTKRNKLRESCFQFMRADSYILSLLALLLCLAALICASIHHVRLTADDTRCEATNILEEHGTCTCTFNAAPDGNSTAAYAAEPENPLMEASATKKSGSAGSSYKVEYRDMSCEEVNCEWVYILVLSITLNAFGFIASLFYIILLACCRRNSKQFYASVQTSTF